MRFLHIGDLHIGKKLNETDISEDIEYVLFHEILGRIFEEASLCRKPDALIISGDIYDRTMPSAMSISTFGRFLAKASELGLSVFAVSGNHDSPQRVSYGREIFGEGGIFLSEPFSPKTPVTVVPYGFLDVVLLPFVTASEVASSYPEEEISDISEAVSYIFKANGIPNKGRPTLLIAHQYVGASNKEIGTLECVNSGVFEDFSYVALGHLHNPHNAGCENIRYCGSPLCYSQSEAENSPDKFVDIIDIDESGNVKTGHIPIIPKRKISVLRDSFNELMSDNIRPSEDYLYITVDDPYSSAPVAAALREKFPFMIKLRYAVSEKEEIDNFNADNKELSFSDSFKEFYETVTGNEISPPLLMEAEEIFNSVCAPEYSEI